MLEKKKGTQMVGLVGIYTGNPQHLLCPPHPSLSPPSLCLNAAAAL